MQKTENPDLILQHMLEEWKYLNDYIIKMDNNFGTGFTIILTIFTGAVIVLFSKAPQNSAASLIIFLVPLTILAIMYYIAYQFRITAILRGHLSKIKHSMNQLLSKEIHKWNSILVETFMAHNNSANSFLMLPNSILLAACMIYCFYATLYVLILNPVLNLSGTLSTILLTLYWILILYLAVRLLLTFLGNEIVRHIIEDEDYVNSLYHVYTEKCSRYCKEDLISQYIVINTSPFSVRGQKCRIMNDAIKSMQCSSSVSEPTKIYPKGNILNKIKDYVASRML